MRQPLNEAQRNTANERSRAWYHANKHRPHVIADHARHRKAGQARWYAVLSWLKDQPCADCNQRFPAECMDFDHRGDKLKCVSDLNDSSNATLQAEVMKCDLVCANCHRTRTKLRGPVLRKVA